MIEVAHYVHVLDQVPVKLTIEIVTGVLAVDHIVAFFVNGTVKSTGDMKSEGRNSRQQTSFLLSPIGGTQSSENYKVLFLHFTRVFSIFSLNTISFNPTIRGGGF